MRSVEEVEDYRSRAMYHYVISCDECAGNNAFCGCRRKLELAVSAYESCIPIDFWNIKDVDIENNRDVFKCIIKPYVNRIEKALSRGYGLLFMGDNGVGKTFFISYILMAAIKRGRTSYFTTASDFDHNIKRGFEYPDVGERLQLMLSSDFIAFDELGKEREKKSNSYTDSQIERLLKRRLDDNCPVLLATNMSFDDFEGAYGPTIASMISGKFQVVQMEPGDFRASQHDRMIDEMKYGNGIEEK